jgi:hypothetical protein
MERLPQSRTEAKEAVYRAFNWAIDTQREGILKIIQHHWPSWTALEIPGRDGVLSPIPLLRPAQERKIHRRSSLHRSPRL